MTNIPAAGEGDYTTDAHTAILQAVRDQHDFGAGSPASWRACPPTSDRPSR